MDYSVMFEPIETMLVNMFHECIDTLFAYLKSILPVALTIIGILIVLDIGIRLFKNIVIGTDEEEFREEFSDEFYGKYFDIETNASPYDDYDDIDDPYD